MLYYPFVPFFYALFSGYEVVNGFLFNLILRLFHINQYCLLWRNSHRSSPFFFWTCRIRFLFVKNSWGLPTFDSQSLFCPNLRWIFFRNLCVLFVFISFIFWLVNKHFWDFFMWWVICWCWFIKVVWLYFFPESQSFICA